MKLKKNKSAFTMIELVFVIVVLGILASLAMDRMDRDLKQEAAESILSHIRLTQSLALRDNKHRTDNNQKWQTAYWRFEYEKCDNLDRYIYRIGSDVDLSGGIQKTEAAVDPIDGKYLWADGPCDSFDNLATDESKEVYLYGRFGIKNISHSNTLGSCTVQNIGFDFLGRPHVGLTSYESDGIAQFQEIMTEDCNLTFTLQTDQNNDGLDDNFTITIQAETGHAFIVGQESL